MKTVLLLGATGSIGRFVARKAVDDGWQVRALVRDEERASRLLPSSVELFVGDGNDAELVSRAVNGIDAVVFTQGAHGNPHDHKNVDYGMTATVLHAVAGKTVRISLMTSIGTTVHTGSYNRASEAHDWKRRAERLVRASGHEYTIVRPGWFDYNAEYERHIAFLQGDRRRAGNSSDGCIARDQIARVLVDALSTPEAVNKTLELVAERGTEQEDLSEDFRSLEIDSGIDGVLDLDTLPMNQEPAEIIQELEEI